MTILHRTAFTAWLALATAFFLVGCGGSSVMVTPDYDHQGLRSAKLKRDNVRVVSVTDTRPTHTSQIGSARVGMFNKEVPFLLNGDLTEAVRIMLDTLIVGRHDQDRFIPLQVSVNMFELGETTKLFGEEGYFACNLRFEFPVTPDSTGNVVIFTKQTDRSVVDVTNAIEPLMYEGMAACARKFVEETLDKIPATMMISSDSIGIVRTNDSARVAVRQQARNVKPKPAIVAADRRFKMNELSFHYSQGNKVKTGVHGSYRMLSRAEGSQFLWGLGVSFTYYNIVNTQDLVKGNFFSLGGTLALKHHLSDAPTTAYVGGNFALDGGSERIDYGYSDQTTFFFGPTLQEVLGLSIGRKFSLEIGSFQLAHFGSKLLPSDVGLMAGVSFGL